MKSAQFQVKLSPPLPTQPARGKGHSCALLPSCGRPRCGTAISSQDYFPKPALHRGSPSFINSHFLYLPLKIQLSGAAAPSENSTDIRNVSCLCFHKALRGLGLPFPAARIIALHFQSDISISLQTDPSLQGSPLGIKQLWRQQKGCDVTNKTTP